MWDQSKETEAPVIYLNIKSKMTLSIAVCRVIVIQIMSGGSTEQLSLGLDEDVCVDGVQHEFANELLSDRNGCFVGDTQVRQIIQKPGGKCTRTL